MIYVFTNTVNKQKVCVFQGWVWVLCIVITSNVGGLVLICLCLNLI